MENVFIIGVSCTPFGKQPSQSFKDLTRQAYLDVLADAGLSSGERIEQAWFGNCGMGTFGQRNIRGQVCFVPLVRDGLFPERAPMINVEGGCATASMALHGAYKDILSGQSELSLAIGVEKTFFPGDAARTLEIFEGGIDQLDPQDWMDYYRDAGERSGKPFAPNAAGGTLFMDTYAMQAAYHMKTFGTTREQIAFAASKNHAMGALNPKAQYQFEVTPEQVLADREVSWPLTRAMCSPIGDGAAAALVCSARLLAGARWRSMTTPWPACPPPCASERCACAPACSQEASTAAWRSRACPRWRPSARIGSPDCSRRTLMWPKCMTPLLFARSTRRRCWAFARSARAVPTWPVARRLLAGSAPSMCLAGWSPRATPSAPRDCR